MKITAITKDNFNEEVVNSELPVLIDFYADWCGPCKMMGPVVEELAKEYEGKAKVAKINVDQEPEIAEKYDVMSIPNFVFIKNGKLVNRFSYNNYEVMNSLRNQVEKYKELQPKN